VGDKRGPGGGDHWSAARASELGTQEAARQAWPASARAKLAGTEHHRRVAALAGTQPRRRCARPSASPLRTAVAPNDTWCIDFKGWFRTGDGARCDPLTLSDAYSRYLLCTKVVDAPGHADCRRELKRVFTEYGLPRVIRSDNGAPFASVGAGGLSRLSAWWVKLGITPERIEPGKPAQNGRHERMHRTLKAECASPPAANRDAQQRRFDEFRREFNHQRPHQALGQTAPGKHYSPSPRSYPLHARLEDPAYPDGYELRRVRSRGEIKWQGELVYVSEALIDEIVGLAETDDGDAEVFFGPMALGLIDGVRLKLLRPRSYPQFNGRARGAAPSRCSPSIGEKVLPILPV
jgi:putative transposase